MNTVRGACSQAPLFYGICNYPATKANTGSQRFDLSLLSPWGTPSGLFIRTNKLWKHTTGYW